jgi:hypothetical protein
LEAEAGEEAEEEAEAEDGKKDEKKDSPREGCGAEEGQEEGGSTGCGLNPGDLSRAKARAGRPEDRASVSGDEATKRQVGSLSAAFLGKLCSVLFEDP